MAMVGFAASVSRRTVGRSMGKSSVPGGKTGERSAASVGGGSGRAIAGALSANKTTTDTIRPGIRASVRRRASPAFQRRLDHLAVADLELAIQHDLLIAAQVVELLVLAEAGVLLRDHLRHQRQLAVVQLDVHLHLHRLAVDHFEDVRPSALTVDGAARDQRDALLLLDGHTRSRALDTGCGG